MTSTDKSAAVREALIERLKTEARLHAQEARTANSTIAEIYRIVSNGTGEPGNWNGAEPVRKCIEGLRAKLASLPPADPGAVALECYDAGLLSNFGGGNVEWWQDYIRAELARAHDHYQAQIEALAAPSVPIASLTTPSKVPAGAVADQDIKDAFYDWCPYDGKDRSELEIFSAGYRTALAAPGAAIDAGEQEGQYDVVGILRAMAHNYRNGHHWDHLDREACLRAVAEINALRSTVSMLSALASRPEAPAASAPAAEVAQPVMDGMPDDLRAAGWSIAVHNDYRMNGEAHTFWLLTKGDRAVKGEGRTDAEALTQIRAALASSPSSAPAESGWQWVSIIRESVRRAEASHSAMSYGDEKSGAVSDYTRGWGDCLVIFKQAASRLPAESAWQWVPKELTPAMIEAAMQVKRERLKEALQQIRAGKDETEARTPVIKGEWDAMLAVAPQAVQAGGEGGNG
ncbi:hypothetical protein [Variovorax sp. 160MFSha2.1]|uniref:hypothetical protein n=1 Tax=Variovorax sp. 160MFSha2.1 TaxID=3158367 RepID=UPI003AABB39D